jgi:hypothetical protein
MPVMKNQNIMQNTSSATYLKELNSDDLFQFLHPVGDALTQTDPILERMAKEPDADERAKNEAVTIIVMLFLCLGIPLFIVLPIYLFNIGQYIIFTALLIMAVFLIVFIINFMGKTFKKMDIETANTLKKLGEEITNILKPVENELMVIPDKYRKSHILRQFCEYLTDGEATSWAECIQRYKTDQHRMEQQESFLNIQYNINRVNRNAKIGAALAGTGAVIGLIGLLKR